MEARTRGRNAGVLAISIAAHLAVLAILAAQRATLAVRTYAPATTEVAIVPFYLVAPRSSPHAAPTSRALQVRRPKAADQGAPIAPLQVPLLPSPTGAGGQAGVGVADHPADHPPGSLAELGRALRVGGVHCGAEALPGLSQADRDRCAERFGAGARTTLAQAPPIAPDKRAYYDASLAARKSDGHGPGVSCHILFGGGAPPSVKAPPHSLKLGPLPCYVVPPAGMLTPEVDVPNPY